MKTLGSRRRLRERALSIFYEADVKEVDPFSLLNSSESPIDKYLFSVLKTYSQNKQLVDELIKKNALEWDASRLNKVDKAILRMAISELLLRDNDVTTKVIIAEANELAEEFSTEKSSRFINGVLSAVIKDLQNVNV
jgi:N utilization substance protein B